MKMKISKYDEKIAAHIKRLHDYNDAKDGGQRLLGKLGKSIVTAPFYITFS